MKRLLDFCFSLIALLLLSPFFVVIAAAILLSSRGGIFYRQVRIGKDSKPFKLLKFRSMRPGSEKSGQLTVGNRDPRITATGHFLRKYKLDELPQLINIILGHMSFVGPRPEVPRYVALYTPEQQKVLRVRPGLTDYASIAYINENELLARAADPEKEYIETIMPAKLQLNLKYIEDQSLGLYFSIIFKTIKIVITNR